MNIKYFTPHWGYENQDFETFCGKIAKAGFDGIEMNLPESQAQAQTVFQTLEDRGLELLAQHSSTQIINFDQHLAHYRASLERITAHKPQVLNCHTGRDFYSFEQNLQLIDTAAEIAKASGVPIIHETHRSRFPFHAALTFQYLEARPDLRLTADFSHWCCVSESLLQGQDKFVDAAISRADHIHSRIGHEQGPQVNDPRAPEWESTVDLFLGWWDRIVKGHRKKGSEQLTITAEFGPQPYTPALPYTQQPVASQWDINIHMMNLLKERYG